MSSKRQSAILIFSKSPEPGKVKTRLLSVLDETECLSLHLALLQDTILKAQSVSEDVFLYLTAESDLPFLHGVTIAQQKGADLGERLLNAFGDALKGYSKVIVIGTDSPTVPPEILTNSIDALETNEIVIGPASDGGYYLIGMQALFPEIFRNIQWGTSNVMAATVAAAGQRRLFLQPEYPDIDLPKDLVWLESEVSACTEPYLTHTREWLKQYAARK